MTPEQQRAIALASARRRRSEAEATQPDTAAIEEPAEEQGFIDRSMDRLQLGLSDAMSTMAGDTFGRTSDDPTKRDNISVPERLLKAAGGDVLPAVGDVSGDALITGGKEVLPDSAQDAIASGATAVMESDAAQAVGEGLEQWKAAHPRSYNIAGEAANVLTAALPVKGLKPKFGGRAMDKLADTEKAARQKSVLNLAIPDDLEGATPVMRTGIGKRVEAEPGPRLKAQVETTEAAPGVRGDKTYTENVSAIDKQIDRIDTNLKKKLEGAAPVDADTIDDEILKAMEVAADTPALRGSPGGVADSINDKLITLLEGVRQSDGSVLPADLLQVRRDLDAWAKSNAPGIFESGTSAAKIANKEIRDALNRIVGDAAPDANLSDDLSTMSQLLNSKSTMLPRAKKEVGTSRFRRYLDSVERDTGFAHPKTPASIAANLGLMPAAFAGTVAGGRQLKKAMQGVPARNIASAQRMMADAIRGGSKGAQRGAILGMLNKDEEELQIPYRR